MNFDWCTTF